MVSGVNHNTTITISIDDLPYTPSPNKTENQSQTNHIENNVVHQLFSHKLRDQKIDLLIQITSLDKDKIDHIISIINLYNQCEETEKPNFFQFVQHYFSETKEGQQAEGNKGEMTSLDLAELLISNSQSQSFSDLARKIIAVGNQENSMEIIKLSDEAKRDLVCDIIGQIDQLTATDESIKPCIAYSFNQKLIADSTPKPNTLNDDLGNLGNFLIQESFEIKSENLSLFLGTNS